MLTRLFVCLFVYLCFNPHTGDTLLSNQSHLRGLVHYVFSGGNDNDYDREREIFDIKSIGIMDINQIWFRYIVMTGV